MKGPPDGGRLRRGIDIPVFFGDGDCDGGHLGCGAVGSFCR